MSRMLLARTTKAPGAGGGTPTYLTINSSVVIAVDANSIWSDDMGIPGIDDLPPLANLESTTGTTIYNISIAGQQWYQMAANITDLNAVWNPAKTNVLICGETRNTIFNGKTYTQCLDEIHAYVAAVKAAHPGWVIVMMGSIPSDGVPSAAEENQAMIAVDNYVRDHLEEFSARSFCTFRDLSPFYQDGTAREGFMSSTATCLEDVPGPYVHPKGYARELMATRMAYALQRIPV